MIYDLSSNPNPVQYFCLHFRFCIRLDLTLILQRNLRTPKESVVHTDRNNVYVLSDTQKIQISMVEYHHFQKHVFSGYKLKLKSSSLIIGFGSTPSKRQLLLVQS